MWTAVVIATAALLLATKWLNCRTTARRVRGPADELNPWARRWMARLGVRPAIWTVFALAAGIIAAEGFVAVWSGSGWAGAAFAALGLPIAAIQGAVARANATGRPNAVTRAVARVYVPWSCRQRSGTKRTTGRLSVRNPFQKEAK